MKKQINIKTEKGLVELFKSVHPDKRLSKEVKNLLVSKLKKYDTISQKQIDKIADLLINAGKIAYSNKRMTVKVDDIKEFAKKKRPSKKRSSKKTSSTSKKRSSKKTSSKSKKRSTKKTSSKSKKRSSKEKQSVKYEECKKNKIATVMREFKNKKLKAKPGYTVTNPKQAIAIALSEAKRFC
jgi:Mg-chelatase subunit ChlI